MRSTCGRWVEDEYEKDIPRKSTAILYFGMRGSSVQCSRLLHPHSSVFPPPINQGPHDLTASQAVKNYRPQQDRKASPVHVKRQ